MLQISNISIYCLLTIFCQNRRWNLEVGIHIWTTFKIHSIWFFVDFENLILTKKSRILGSYHQTSNDCFLFWFWKYVRANLHNELSISLQKWLKSSHSTRKYVPCLLPKFLKISRKSTEKNLTSELSFMSYIWQAFVAAFHVLLTAHIMQTREGNVSDSMKPIILTWFCFVIFLLLLDLTSVKKN